MISVNSLGMEKSTFFGFPICIWVPGIGEKHGFHVFSVFPMDCALLNWGKNASGYNFLKFAAKSLCSPEGGRVSGRKISLRKFPGLILGAHDRSRAPHLHGFPFPRNKIAAIKS